MLLSPLASMPAGQRQIPTNADLMAYLEKPDHWALAEAHLRNSVWRAACSGSPSSEFLGPVIDRQEKYNAIGNHLRPRVANILNLPPETLRAPIVLPVSKNLCVKAGLLFTGADFLFGAGLLENMDDLHS